MALAIIAKIGTAGGTGHVIEYAGEAVRALSMEGRMTLCNMTIEGGARAGLVAPDETTFAYIAGRPRAPKAAAFEAAANYWRTLKSDDGAPFDIEVELEARDIAPMVTWGTSPEQGLPITGEVPDPAAIAERSEASWCRTRARLYGSEAGHAAQGCQDRSRLHRLLHQWPHRGPARRRRHRQSLKNGKKVAAHVGAMVVPGSGLVKHQAEEEGLDKIFIEAGFEWREPGCSMCLAMNADKLEPGERCASTSNRNFEGRQGRGGRTHLVSPAMAAAAAIAGHLADVREFQS